MEERRIEGVRMEGEDGWSKNGGRGWIEGVKMEGGRVVLTFFRMAMPSSCKNSLVLSASCPATTLDGFTRTTSP